MAVKSDMSYKLGIYVYCMYIRRYDYCCIFTELKSTMHIMQYNAHQLALVSVFTPINVTTRTVLCIWQQKPVLTRHVVTVM